MDNIEDQINEIKAKIASYSSEDVYNMDEIAYFYNLASDKTIARRQIEGAKKDKTHLIIALTCNSNRNRSIRSYVDSWTCRKTMSYCLSTKLVTANDELANSDDLEK